MKIPGGGGPREQHETAIILHFSRQQPN